MNVQIVDRRLPSVLKSKGIGESDHDLHYWGPTGREVNFSNQIKKWHGWTVFSHLHLLRIKFTWSLLKYLSLVLFKILCSKQGVLRHSNGRKQNLVTEFLCLNRKPIIFPPQEGANSWPKFPREKNVIFFFFISDHHTPVKTLEEYSVWLYTPKPATPYETKGPIT